ncbi:hypothetical protein, partial [Streptomyces adustus]
LLGAQGRLRLLRGGIGTDHAQVHVWAALVVGDHRTDAQAGTASEAGAVRIASAARAAVARRSWRRLAPAAQEVVRLRVAAALESGYVRTYRQAAEVFGVACRPSRS